MLTSFPYSHDDQCEFSVLHPRKFDEWSSCLQLRNMPWLGKCADLWICYQIDGVFDMHARNLFLIFFWFLTMSFAWSSIIGIWIWLFLSWAWNNSAWFPFIYCLMNSFDWTLILVSKQLWTRSDADHEILIVTKD